MKRFRRFLIATIAAAIVGFAGFSPQGRADDKDEGWIQLFNGKDLTGWKMYDPPSGEFKGLKEVKNDDGKVTAFVGEMKKDGKEVTLWQVKDGMIVGGGPSSHLFTDIEAENFRYRVVAKINDHGNSGQYFRTKFGPGFPNGYETQINATHGDPVRTGSLYPAGGLGKYRDKICVLKIAPHKPDEFFTQEVIADGPKITIIVNGKVMLGWFKFTDKTAAALEKAKVPGDVITKLDALKDKAFLRNDLISELGKLLTKEEKDGYQDVILDTTATQEGWEDPNKTYTKGHFALQGHDPGSVMTFKKVEYKPLQK